MTNILDPTTLDGIFNQDDAYDMSEQNARVFRQSLIWKAVAWHRSANERYDRYCTRKGLDDSSDPDRPLSTVPLLPTVLFKRGARTVMTPTGCAVMITTSSGTQGGRSEVPRCDRTMTRFFASVVAGDREVFRADTFDRHVFHVGPTIADQPDVWISYVMAGLTLLLPGTSYFRSGRPDVQRLIDDLRRHPADSPVSLVGPPAYLLEVAEAAAAQGVSLGGRATVLSIGGWKRAAASAVDPTEFRRRIVEALRLSGSQAVRDVFNMVELNSVLFECEQHILHVPPWLHADARDPRSGSVLPAGHIGVLSFLDPTALSYPCFLLSDDLGAVHAPGSCPCGRPGSTMQVVRRINRVEMRGCALRTGSQLIAPPRQGVSSHA